eukprot:scaffold138190_cov136-Phaeocystis_antarctica.AAC.1
MPPLRRLSLVALRLCAETTRSSAAHERQTWHMKGCWSTCASRQTLAYIHGPPQSVSVGSRSTKSGPTVEAELAVGRWRWAMAYSPKP